MYSIDTGAVYSIYYSVHIYLRVVLKATAWEFLSRPDIRDLMGGGPSINHRSTALTYSVDRVCVCAHFLYLVQYLPGGFLSQINGFCRKKKLFTTIVTLTIVKPPPIDIERCRSSVG